MNYLPVFLFLVRLKPSFLCPFLSHFYFFLFGAPLFSFGFVGLLQKVCICFPFSFSSESSCGLLWIFSGRFIELSWLEMEDEKKAEEVEEVKGGHSLCRRWLRRDSLVTGTKFSEIGRQLFQNYPSFVALILNSLSHYVLLHQALLATVVAGNFLFATSDITSNSVFFTSQLGTENITSE